MTPPAPRPRLRPRQGDEHDPGLLLRRDVVAVPAVLLALGGIAFAMSQLLRPASEFAPGDRAILIAIGLGVSVMAGTLGSVALLLWERMRRRVVGATVYVAGTALMTAALVVVGLRDGGLGSISAQTFVLVTPYMALVLPGRLAWPGAVGLVGFLLLLGATAGGGPGATGPVLIAIVIAGFIAGRMPRRSLVTARRRAVRVARWDALTGLLNRRGFEAEADHRLGLGAATGQAVALLAVDLDGFKLVNDRDGHQAGDELLAWVGKRIAALAPGDAVVGRMGGDEFAVLLPGTDAGDARALGTAIAARLSERTGASIGVASRGDGQATREALLHDADAALYDAKRAPASGVVCWRPVAVATLPAPAPAPVVTFAELRRDPPLREGQVAAADPHWLLHGHLIALATGALLVAGGWLLPADGPWGDWFRWGGFLYLIVGSIYAVLLWKRPMDPEHASMGLLAGSTATTAFGMFNAAMAGGGLLSPVTAAFHLSAMHDAAITRFRETVTNSLVLFAGIVAIMVAGPEHAWAIPFTLTLFATGLGLGWVARRALADALADEQRLATTDPLTGLLLRAAFAQRVRSQRRRMPGGQAGLLVVDLDGFKAVNDTLGHEAGDRVLVAVAGTLRSTLGAQWDVGRRGGDEFIAFTADISSDELAAASSGLDRALTHVARGSVGAARFGVDGAELDEVARVADARSYARKLARRAVPADARASA